MKKLFKVKKPILKISVTLIYIACSLLLYHLKIGCFYRYFLGFRCIGCGLTTAYVNAFNLDFISAFKSHFMFLSVPILYCYIWFDGKLTGKKKLDTIILILILIGFLIRWILYYL